MKHVVLTLVVLALSAATASAQQQAWAEKLFDKNLRHDFGGVPHGAQVKYSFPVKNIYAVPLTFIEVRSSCGCLTPIANPTTLKPQETGTIDVIVDTVKFQQPGFKEFTVRVTVGPQYVSTANLKVTITSRTDVVFNPGQINFGVVPQGQTPTQVVNVDYAGALDWKMVQVIKHPAAPIKVEVNEVYRQAPQKQGAPWKVGYRIQVELNKDAPPGLIKQELILKTNDQVSPQLTLQVEGTVQARLSVAPTKVNYGTAKVGETKTLLVQVRGDRPFRILGVNGTDAAVQVDVPNAAAQNHLLTIRLQPKQAGDLRRTLEIRTDLDNAVLTLPVEAVVTP
jgi:hypothetical protein